MVVNVPPDLLGVPSAERTHPEAYPLWGRFDGLPKTYVQICDVDILCDDAVCYVRGLQNADIEVRVSFYKVCLCSIGTMRRNV
jgi:acetyl esterase/lipase